MLPVLLISVWSHQLPLATCWDLLAIGEQVTTSIRLLCAGWDLPRWDPKAEDVLFVCKAAAEELADEHSPVSAGVGRPGLLPDGFAFRGVMGQVPCAWLSNRSRRCSLLWGIPGALGKPGDSSSPQAGAGNSMSSPVRPLLPGQQVPAGPSHRNAGAQAVWMLLNFSPSAVLV